MMAAPFDLDRLDAEERALCDKYFTGPSQDGDVVRVMGFAQACSLELSGPPDVVGEYLAEHRDGVGLVHQYVENVKQAHRVGGRKPKPTKRKPIGYRVVVKPVRSRPVDPESVPASHPMRVWFEQAGLPWPPA
jgi:hypothetical protein